MRFVTAAIAYLIATSCHAGVTIEAPEPTAFDPSREETCAFSVTTTEPGTLDVDIFTSDGDLVRTITMPNVPAGKHKVAWNGHDEQGAVVPNEAYVPVAVLHRADGQEETADPRTSSGGEVLEGLDVSVSPDGDISYTLPQPARVLIRTGIKGGAMLRSLSIWQPRPEGRNLQRWNGFDADGLVDLRNDRLAVLVTAFALPQGSVITTGNAATDYRGYRLAQGWKEDRGNPVDFPLSRSGQRLSRHYFFPRYKDREPAIAVSLTAPDGTRIESGTPVPKQVRVLVDIPQEDRWLMEESLYEVAFFVDGEFVSEEEHGYVPIGWLWDTSALSPGPHLLTVNVTGFTGKVGVRSILIER